MINKRYDLKGLDIRSSDINRPIGKSSDCQNVQLNSKGELIKRYGFDKLLDDTIVDIFEYKKLDRLIVQKADGFYYFNGTSLVAINYQTVEIPDTTKKLNASEYNGVIYFTDPSGENELYKYDGAGIYRAGVPRPEVAITAGGGVYSYRVFLRFRDRRGNVTSGDYVQFDGYSDGAFFAVEHMDNGFYEKWAEVDGPQITGLGQSDVITVKVGHNYVAGDTVYITGDQRADYDDIAEFFDVVSVTATTITLDISNSKADFVLNPDRALESRTAIILSQSTDATYGYMTSSGESQSQYGLNKTSGPIATVTTPGGYATLTLAMDDIYDPTILKGLPPKCKYIGFYNNIMVIGNRANTSEDVNFSNTEAESTLFWSDTGVGSTVETFPPFNLYQVGRSSEGEITGIFGSSDNVTILKERQVYYLNGNLVLNSYRARSSMSNGVGCVAYGSILEVEGGCVFMSSRGIYLASYGNKPVELSDTIEPIFTQNPYDLDLSTAVTVNDVQNERIYIHIKSNSQEDITLEYDYFWKEWFIHRGILASSGMAFVSSELYHAGPSSLYKSNELYRDDTKAISAYWKSGWENLGFPTVVKKFVKFVLVSLSDLSWTLNLKTQDNWNPLNEKTDQSIDIDPYSCTKRSIDMTQKNSMRIEMRNDIKNQGMLITGYEFIAEETQEIPKGDK